MCQGFIIEKEIYHDTKCMGDTCTLEETSIVTHNTACRESILHATSTIFNDVRKDNKLQSNLQSLQDINMT